MPARTKHRLLTKVFQAAVISLFTTLPAFAQSVTVPTIEIGDHQSNAIDLLRAGKVEEAAREAQLGLDAAQKTGQQQYVASALSVLAKVYRRQERYQDSLKNYQEALEYWKKQPGQTFNEAMILNNMGEEYRTLNQLDKALPVLLEAKSKLTETDINYWAIMENLGNIYFKQGKLADAEAAWKKAAETAHTSTDYRSEIDSLSGLATIYYKQGRKSELNTAAEQAITLTTTRFGPSDSRIAFLKKLQAAGATAGDKPALSQDDTAWKTEMNVAMQALKSGKFAEAEKPLQRALKEAERFGPEDPRLAISLSNLGVVYFKLEKLPQAESYLVRALPIARKTSGPQNQPIISILDSLVPTYLKQGKLEQAEPLLKEFIPLQEKTPGYSPQDIAATKVMYKNLQAAIERRKQQKK